VGVYRIQKSANALPEFLRKGVHWVPSRSDIIFNANEALRPASFIRPFSADLSGRLCPVIACNELMSAQFAIQLFETPMNYRSLLLAATSEVRGSLSSPKQFWGGWISSIRCWVPFAHRRPTWHAPHSHFCRLSKEGSYFPEFREERALKRGLQVSDAGRTTGTGLVTNDAFNCLHVTESPLLEPIFNAPLIGGKNGKAQLRRIIFFR
jgi:hypothetical protein